MGAGLCIYSRKEKHKRNMDKYKVAIVDDDEVALENLSFELGKDARFSLKGTARNGKQGKNSLPRYSRICCSWMWKCRI